MFKLNNLEAKSIGGGQPGQGQPQPRVESFTGQACDFAGGMKAIAGGAIGGAAAGAVGGPAAAAVGAVTGGFASSAVHTAGCLLNQ
jgi:hypothetical protein